MSRQLMARFHDGTERSDELRRKLPVCKEGRSLASITTYLIDFQQQIFFHDFKQISYTNVYNSVAIMYELFAI